MNYQHLYGEVQMNCIQFIKQLGTQVKMMHIIFICIFHMTLEQKCVYLSNEAYYTAFTCEHIGATQLKKASFFYVKKVLDLNLKNIYTILVHCRSI